MTLDNKLMAGGTYGDSDPLYPSVEPDNAADVAADGAGIPSGGINNKFDVSTSFGDGDPVGTMATAENLNEFGKDSAGVPNPNMGEMSPMALTLEGNKFPREGYESKITAEEAQLT